MEKFIKGDVVVIPFHFTDLSNAIRRPCLVISELIGDDIILCQITSRKEAILYSISLSDIDFENGQLNVNH